MRKKKPITRRVRNEHGYPVLYLGKKFLNLMGSEVIIEKVGSNPLLWELKIRPLFKKNVKGSSQGKGNKEPS